MKQNEFKSRLESETMISKYVLTTGYDDQKGREIGIFVRNFECEFVPVSENYKGLIYCLDAGKYFCVYIHVTRDGIIYGATTPTRYFKTEAERDAYIAKRFAAINKKAKVGA